MKVNVAILGCSGRMGRHLVQAAVEHESIKLVGGSIRASSSFVDCDLGELAGIGAIGKTTSIDINALLAADIFIDFTSIASTFEHLAWCKENNKAIVIGTTGFSDEQVKQIKSFGQYIPVILAPLKTRV